MVIQFHSTIPRNLTPEKFFEFNNGILHVSLSYVLIITLQYYIKTSSILLKFTECWQGAGFDVLYFTSFLTEVVWTHIYPDQSVTNLISARLTKTYTLTIPSLYSPISALPTSATPPTNNSPSNDHVKPTTAIIVLVHQTIHQNATMMAHLQTQPSPPLVQPTLIYLI